MGQARQAREIGAVGGFVFQPLRPRHYQLIVVDPPWSFELFSERGNQKSASRHYRTMSDQEILALPVGRLAAKDCMLLLWATAPQLPLAIQAVETWGFRYKSFMVWRKITASGRVRMGTGFRVRSSAELVILATCGNPKQAFVPSTIFDGLARQHSRKPETFYDIAERMMPGVSRCDVFARQRRDGWDSFGDQADRFSQE